jgi:hypothetical protein
MSANNQSNSKTPANNDAPKQPKLNPREQLLQDVLETYPLLTREKAEEMLRAYGAY